jgi:hypothetical protein
MVELEAVELDMIGIDHRSNEAKTTIKKKKEIV